MKRSSVVSVCIVALLGACQAQSVDPPDTVGSLPLPEEATTLLPDVVVSYVPDDTLPPGVLFAGQLCNALTADDVATVSIAGPGRATLLNTQELADDLCGFVVRAGGDEYTLLVRARSIADFATANDFESWNLDLVVPADHHQK